MSEFDADVIELTEPNMRWAKDDKLYVRFYSKAVHQPVESAEAGRPIYKDVDYIKIIIPGDKLAEVDDPVSEHYAERFAAKYRAFKAGKEDPLRGTPLEAWPVLNQVQVAELKHLHLRTVEDIISAPDNLQSQIMGYNKLKAQATKFVDVAAEVAAEARLDAKVAAAVAKQVVPESALAK